MQAKTWKKTKIDGQQTFILTNKDVNSYLRKREETKRNHPNEIEIFLETNII